MKYLWVTVVLAWACACSATSDDVPNDDDASGSGASSGGNLNFGGNGSGGNGQAGDCSEAAKLIYVLTDTGLLYSFKPDEKLFTLVGPMSCPTAAQPNSMAVDRQAVAWVNYVDNNGISDSAGTIWRVSTADASCAPAPSVNLPAGWYRIGMGYSTDSAGGDSESLFVTGIGLNGSLGRIANDMLIPVANFSGSLQNQDAELTGTGDGRLFGFFTSNPVAVAELDKTTAAALSNVPLPTVEVPNAWAFSFWGGDFYLYTASLGNSRVNRYRPSDGTVDPNYMPDVGFRIVGAGVSTCAPLTPPN